MDNTHSITEYTKTLAELTNTNLEILNALNNAFYTKSDHVTVNIGGNKLTIPSFLSLESKITDLTESFKHLVDCPINGVAEFNFDGNTQSIEMIGFNNEPNLVDISKTIPAGGLTNYSSRFDDIFKDMVTPSVFINFDLSSLPEHINEILIKKIIIKNPVLVKTLELDSKSQSIVTYADMVKYIYNYTEDKDYIEYDTRKTLPIKNNDYFGEYDIIEIIDNYTDVNFVQWYEVKISNQLTYKFNNNTIEYNLAIGDQLMSYDNKAKYTITNIDTLRNVLTLRVDNGFSEILDVSSNTKSKLKFFNDTYTNTKFKKVEVTLEEDQYVVLFIAPINSKINTRAQWSDGISINTYKLTDSNGTPYNEYYKTNVKNIGDTLLNICQYTDVIVTNMIESDLNTLTKSKPSIKESDLEVLQINKHLNDTKSLDNISKLNIQKTQIQNDLSNCQTQIDNINNLLAKTNFSDSSSTSRETYVTQLDKLLTQKRSLNKSYITIVNEIKNSADNAVIPIEKSKFRIRGFFDVDNYINTIKQNLTFSGIESVGLEVEYRYKNINKNITTATTIGESFLYSSWTRLNTLKRNRLASWVDGKISYSYETVGSTEDKPCFNQIDIPISQGEQVDIRIKVIYNAGQPYISMMSSWSDIITIKFPDSLITSMDVYDIVVKNNDDIQDASFKNILIESGMYDHADDKIVDQTVTFFHKPEHVSSGFFTPERRIIPLSEKLKDIDTEIQSIKQDLGDDVEDTIKVIISDGDDTIVVKAGEEVNYILDDFSTVDESKKETINIGEGGSQVPAIFANQVLTIQISNSGRVPVKLWSMFPGSSGSNIDGVATKFTYDDFSSAQMQKSPEDNTLTQVKGQYLYVRAKDPYTGVLYGEGNNKVLHEENGDTTNKHLYTYLTSTAISNIRVDGDSYNSKLVIKPGESKLFYLTAKYNLDTTTKTKQNTFAFDIRPSLYSDPLNFSIKITANYENTVSTKIAKKRTKNIYNPVVK